MSTITKNFTKVWLQERSIITVYNSTGAAYVDLLNGSTRLARYSFDNSRNAVIDITDYMRAYPSTSSLNVQVSGESAVAVQTPVAGLINPEHLIIPQNSRLPNWKIAPPSMMLQDIGTPIVFEAYGHDDYSAYFTDKTVGNPEDVQDGSNELPVGSTWLQIEIDQQPETKILLKPLLCGVKYAAVEWISAVGYMKRHTFELIGVKSSTRGDVSLQTADNSFRVLKGRTDGFSLVLGSLNSYDMSYYSDIVYSSDVKVSLDGVTWQSVEVTSNSSQIPDGDGELGKLEIAVNFRKYDSI